MKKVLMGIGGGGFAIQAEKLIHFCPEEVELLIIAPDEMKERLNHCLQGHSYQFVEFRGFRKQRRNDKLIINFLCLVVGIWLALRVIRRFRPIAVVAIGQRISAYLMAASRLAGVPGYFIECITRVSKPSSTGKFISIFRIAKKIYVQWPEATKLYKNAVYRGILL